MLPGTTISERMLTVTTSYGKLLGNTEKGICVWKGVKYASAPVGDGRFDYAGVPEKWDGIRSAKEYAKKNMQYSRKGDYSGMSEDCLSLNIWSPAADDKKRAVMVYIHGGSFESGSGNDPDLNGAILSGRQDVVVVNVNYRTGVFGFMDFEELGDGFKPNCGVHDIIMALKWVSEEIDSFGGDGRNITIFGQSSGAITISALITIPEAQKYISKAIMMSTGPTLFKSRDEGLAAAKMFLRFSKLSAGELKSISAEKLTELQEEFKRYTQFGAGTYSAVIDGALIKDFPIISARKGMGKRIPLLIGSTREEMSFLFIKPVAKVLEIDKLFAAGVNRESGDLQQEIAEKYRRFGRRANKRMVSDLVFKLGGMWLAEICSRDMPVWMYSFDYETPPMRLSGLHSFHSSDIPFVFGNYNYGIGKVVFFLTFYRKTANRISRMMQKDFADFARTGKCGWQAVSEKNTPAKCFNRKITYRQIIDDDIKESLWKTDYRRISFGEMNGSTKSLYE